MELGVICEMPEVMHVLVCVCMCESACKSEIEKEREKKSERKVERGRAAKRCHSLLLENFQSKQLRLN